MHHHGVLHAFVLAITCAVALPAAAQIQNPGFEAGFDAWLETDPTGKAVSLSEDTNSGEKSAKIKEKSGTLQTAVPLIPGQTYVLSAHIKGAGLLGAKVGKDLYFDRQPKSKKWTKVSVTFEAGTSDRAIIFAGYNGAEGRFDDFTLESTAQDAGPSAKVVLKRDGGSGLLTGVPPAQNFDLLGWALSTPADDNKDGKADAIGEIVLAKGYTQPDYFYTGEDGGMVFRATIGGAKTSKNTKYTRSELREMLRRGDSSIRTRISDGTPNKNNWVFSIQPKAAQDAAGAVDGRLEATLAVNHVTTTGNEREVGAVVIGQIHAKDDEPIRLYYQKRPGHKNGSIFAAHEPIERPDIWFDILGSRADRDTDPADGIALGERFSYAIDAKGSTITAIITQAGKELGRVVIDQSGSGYDVEKDFMYFKAGVYNQNHTGTDDDYVQATFYALKASH